VDHGESITQKLKGIIPAMDYDRLEQELADTKVVLAAEKKMNSRSERKDN
jgi:hypothetical protein